MKSLRLVFIVISLISIFIIGFHFFTSYRSAFEADQACHYEKWKTYEDKVEYGCDHDLETKQWILFEKGLMREPAKVIKRFRY